MSREGNLDVIDGLHGPLVDRLVSEAVAEQADQVAAPS